MTCFYFIKDTNIANYADDSTLYTVERNMEDLLNTLENETSSILNWFRMNEMKPNDDKCHLIVTNQDSALARISKYLNEEKLKIIMKTFIQSQFSYCPLGCGITK